MLDYLKNLGVIVPHAAKTFGDKVALVFKDREFTYRELDELTNRLANSLKALGIKGGDRVSLYSQNCWQWLVSYYAIGKLGGVVNPVNVMLTPEEVRYVVDDCEVTAIILSRDKALKTQEAVKGSPSIKHMICYEEVGEGILSFQDLLDQGATDPVRSDCEPADISTIGYTSGTTGHPKGAALSHRAVLTNVLLTANMYVKTKDDIVVSALPCAHVYGNVVMSGALALGGTLVMIERFEEQEVLESIQKYRATMLEGVPTMYLYLLNYPDLNRYDLSSLTRMGVGGQTMSVDKMKEVEARFGCPLIELWGMTEIAGLGTTAPLYGKHKHGSIGIPLPGVEARIVDTENADNILKPHDVGELMIRGPIVMEKYWGNKAATEETIEKDGWLHTGDVGSMDEDGYIFIVDRKKDMILTGGYNVYPAEIEKVLLKNDKVAMAAVGKLPDELKGESALACIVLKNGESATVEEINGYCREHLASYKVPRQIAFVDELPTTSTGKIMRRDLKDIL
jgi:long-chain acyl-CoA synthetase